MTSHSLKVHICELRKAGVSIITQRRRTKRFRYGAKLGRYVLREVHV